jgi:hypothetical protein
MNAWKLIAYPIGLCLVAVLLVNLAAILVFGPNADQWATWQNEFVGAFGVFAGMLGLMSGVYFSVKAVERSLP